MLDTMTGELSPEPEKSAGVLLTERLAYWNEFFDQAGQDNIDELSEYGHQAVSELNELWQQEGLMGEMFLVNGYAVLSVRQDEAGGEQGDTVDEPQELAFSVKTATVTVTNATSRGFTFGNLLAESVDESKPGIFYWFEVGKGEVMTHMTMLHQITQYMFVHPRGISVMPMAALEEPFFMGKLAQGVEEEEADYTVGPMEIIDNCSEELSRLVRSTGFRRRKRQTQLKQVDQLVDRAETSGIRESSVLLETYYAYASSGTAEGSIAYEIIDLHDVLLSGVCLGLSMLGREQLNRKAIRRDDDLLGKHDGLSMAIELDDDIELPSCLELSPGNVIHVPISSQEIGILIDPSERMHQMMEAEAQDRESSRE